MLNWKDQLQSLLGGLIRTHGKSPLSEIRRILRGVLQVEGVTFHDQDGRELPGDTPLHKALDKPCELSVRLPCAPISLADADDAAAAAQYGPPRESRFREDVLATPAVDPATDPRYTQFLHEFLRLEQHHDFMWAGYIVRELLPRIGFAAEEAKAVLDRLRVEEVIIITKVPNPKNPDFPATGVKLNRDHPRVKALLGKELPAAERADAEEVNAQPNEPVSG